MFAVKHLAMDCDAVASGVMVWKKGETEAKELSRLLPRGASGLRDEIHHVTHPACIFSQLAWVSVLFWNRAVHPVRSRLVARLKSKVCIEVGVWQPYVM